MTVDWTKPIELADVVPDADGWIAWTGGECPVDPDTQIEWRCDDVERVIGPGRAGDRRWDHGIYGNITQYRVVKPVKGNEPVKAVKAEDADTVTFKRITEEEAAALAKIILARYNSTVTKDIIDALREFSIIKEPETPIEKFARETGVTITDENRAAVEAALLWAQSKENSAI